MNEYRVKILVKNNLILTAVENAGYKNQADFARSAGMTPSEFNDYVALRKAPINQSGEFKPTAKLIMEALGCCPSDLWTEKQLTMELYKNYSERNVGEIMMQNLIDMNNEAMTLPDPFDHVLVSEKEKVIAEILEELTPKQEKIIRLRNGIGCEEKTLLQVGEIFEVTKERVRQIEAKAMRKLRHSNISKKIKYLNDQ